MIEVTKPKFDPIPLPGIPGVPPTGGPRIGEPVPAPPPKSAAGPVLANKPDSPAGPSTAPPAPVWVKEAIGRLLFPTRTKAAVLAAAAALGGGMYAAKLFTADTPDGPTTTAVLDVAKPDPAPTTPTPTPNPLPTLVPTAVATAPAPSITLGDIPLITTPTAADQFRGRDAASPPLPSAELTRNHTTVNTPDPTQFAATPMTSMTAVPTLPAPTGSPSTIPSITVPSIPAPNLNTIRTVDNTTPPGGIGAVIPAGSTIQPPPAATTTTPALPVPSIGDIPSVGGGSIGGGATGMPTAVPVIPGPTGPSTTPTPVPTLTTPPPAPVVPSLTGTTTTPTPVPTLTTPTPAPVVPSLTGTTGGGSIGSGAVTPGTLPTLSPSPPVGFDTGARRRAPVPTAPKEPETSFDVDVHTIKQGESYASISKSYYGDASFGDALRTYDAARGRADGTVHVPPVWVLRKRFPQAIRGEATVPPAATVPAERTTVPVVTTSGGVDWNSARGTAKAKSYTLTKPMTMREVAKEAFGDELYWNRVWDLNLNLSTDAMLSTGTKVNLPGDSKVGQ